MSSRRFESHKTTHAEGPSARKADTVGSILTKCLVQIAERPFEDRFYPPHLSAPPDACVNLDLGSHIIAWLLYI